MSIARLFPEINIPATKAVVGARAIITKTTTG
jgi:hypothetical protein